MTNKQLVHKPQVSKKWRVIKNALCKILQINFKTELLLLMFMARIKKSLLLESHEIFINNLIHISRIYSKNKRSKTFFDSLLFSFFLLALPNLLTLK